MQPVYMDLMGPFTPVAKGGYRFVSKFTDDYSRMKEIFLLKNKTEAAESLHQYNMTVAAPLGLRIEDLRCDKGGEYTGQEFRTLCVGAGINIEYTATNTPQQNGVSERDGQTLAKITRCLMKDGDFPPFMWGELMFTAKYLANRSSHSTLEGATPYSKMHNLEPDLTGLRAIGARAFVHRETYTKKLEDRAFEGKLCGYSHNSKACRIYKSTVVESRNVTFLETPAYMLRKASVARVDRRLRRYYLIGRLLPNVFALACLSLSSISEILDRRSFRSGATLFFIYFFPKQPCLND